MDLTTRLLVFHALFVLPLTHAWTFVWRNASNDSFVEHSDTTMPCTKIDHAQGRLFEWDAEEGPFAISLYSNSDCSGPPGGYATHLFNKNASRPIDSFKVDSTASTTTTASMNHISSATSVTTTSQAPTSTATGSASSSGSSLSGGAITGLVIGVVVGAALVGGALYLIGRRRRRPSPGGDNGANMGYGSPATYSSPSCLGPALAPLETTKQASSSGAGSSVNPVRVVELQGDGTAAELSNSNVVNELEGYPRSPISPP